MFACFCETRCLWRVQLCGCACLCGCVFSIVPSPLLGVLRLRSWARARALSLLAREHRAFIQWERRARSGLQGSASICPRSCEWRALLRRTSVPKESVLAKESAGARVPLSPPAAELRGGRARLTSRWPLPSSEVGVRAWLEPAGSGGAAFSCSRRRHKLKVLPA